MMGDKEVIEYLNRALRHVLTAVNEYWLHYRLRQLGLQSAGQDVAQGID